MINRSQLIRRESDHVHATAIDAGTAASDRNSGRGQRLRERSRRTATADRVYCGGLDELLLFGAAVVCAGAAERGFRCAAELGGRSVAADHISARADRAAGVRPGGRAGADSVRAAGFAAGREPVLRSGAVVAL